VLLVVLLQQAQQLLLQGQSLCRLGLRNEPGGLQTLLLLLQWPLLLLWWLLLQ
jgi:hypothetical protein